MARPITFRRIVSRVQRELRKRHPPQFQLPDYPCPVCGHVGYSYDPVLWTKLIREWQIAPDEVEMIDRREGTRCTNCSASLRSMALADAICTAVGTNQTLSKLVTSPEAKDLQVLEVNHAGSLNSTLSQLLGHRLAVYPDVDMLRMPYADGTFDLIVHSDTLEHVPNPIAALAECRRVLKQHGSLCYTIPIISSRMSRSREGLPPSYHGNSDVTGDDWKVQTEYGADAWVHVLRAGFTNATFHALDYPIAFAIIAS